MGATMNYGQHGNQRLIATGATALLLATVLIPTASAQGGDQAMFDPPFVVEHRIVQTDAEASTFSAEPITDYYVGTSIVSLRSDGSWRMVDFARHEIIEVVPHPEKPYHSVLSFDRFVELRQRLYRAEQRQVGLDPQVPNGGSGTGTVRIEELAVAEISARARLANDTASAALLDRPGVRCLRVSDSEKGAGAGIEVVLDATVRLDRRALAALARFERDVLAADTSAKASGDPISHLAAAREHGGGAFPIYTRRPAITGRDIEQVGAIADVVTRLEHLASVPSELTTVPEDSTRTVHRLEQMVEFAEEEAERAELAFTGR